MYSDPQVTSIPFPTVIHRSVKRIYPVANGCVTAAAWPRCRNRPAPRKPVPSNVCPRLAAAPEPTHPHRVSWNRFHSRYATYASAATVNATAPRSCWPKCRWPYSVPWIRTANPHPLMMLYALPACSIRSNSRCHPSWSCTHSSRAMAKCSPCSSRTVGRGLAMDTDANQAARGGTPSHLNWTHRVWCRCPQRLVSTAHAAANGRRSSRATIAHCTIIRIAWIPR